MLSNVSFESSKRLALLQALSSSISKNDHLGKRICGFYSNLFVVLKLHSNVHPVLDLKRLKVSKSVKVPDRIGVVSGGLSPASRLPGISGYLRCLPARSNLSTSPKVSVVCC